ncbi:nucleotidyltransferase domain-containing protein, partial [Streptomyces koyangensis]
MERVEAPYGAWEPASVTEVATLFSPLRQPWWIAGGYAVELAVGRAFRSHADIDVLLLHEDQLAAQHALAGWEWWAADPPGTLRPWSAGEILPPGVHDIWCRPGPDAPWRVQLIVYYGPDGP